VLVDAAEARLQLKDKHVAANRRMLEAEHPQQVIQMEMTVPPTTPAR
jgi:hypothetical protein